MVFGHVSSVLDFAHKPDPAICAGELPIWIMHSHMSFDVLLIFVSLIAERAREVPLLSVHSHVLLQMTSLGERFLTNFASNTLQVILDSMSGQRFPRLKVRVTRLTFELERDTVILAHVFHFLVVVVESRGTLLAVIYIVQFIRFTVHSVVVISKLGRAVEGDLALFTVEFPLQVYFFVLQQPLVGDEPFPAPFANRIAEVHVNMLVQEEETCEGLRAQVTGEDAIFCLQAVRYNPVPRVHVKFLLVLLREMPPRVVYSCQRFIAQFAFEL